jgi:hypothetical protein
MGILLLFNLVICCSQLTITNKLWRTNNNHNNNSLSTHLLQVTEYDRLYTGSFRRKCQYFGSRQYRSLWEKDLNTCLILNGYRDTAVWNYRPNSVRYLLVGWRTKYTQERWIHETNCSLALWMLLLAKTRAHINSDNTRSSYTSCRVHWRWELRSSGSLRSE